MAGISRTRMLKMQTGDPFLGLSVLGGLIGKGVGALFRRGAKRVSNVLASRSLPRTAGIIRSRTGGLIRQHGGRILRTGAGAAGAGLAFEGGRRLIRGPGGELIEAPRRRRMNPCNVKALRRATRRLSSFNKMATKTQRELAKLAPSRRRSTTRSAPMRGGGAGRVVIAQND